MNSQTEITSDPSRASEILAAGGVVALPTETVYGLAARYDDTAAVSKIFIAKERPSDNPLIVHVADRSWLDRIASEVPRSASTLLEHFSPGPITVTLPRSLNVPDMVTAGLNSVAVRIPSAPLFQQVLQSVGVPLVAPSANRSGRPSPTTWQAARDELIGRVDAILVGPPCEIGVESTVVDCCRNPPRLLRPGAISLEELQSLIPDLTLYQPAPSKSERPQSEPAESLASPGLKYRHYAPRIPVHLVEDVSEIQSDPQAMLLTTTPHATPQSWGHYDCFDSPEAYARELFSAFRIAEEMGLHAIYCQRVPETGIGRALMDRLRRAAQDTRL